jgi:Arc/MetJ-type ribon-helix-helix transcriptional regulator
MSETVVSIRIPGSMIKELRERIKKDHYLDVSEAVRGVVRKRWMEWKDPNAYQIKKLREEIKDVVEEKSKKTKEEELLDELQRIREMILSKGEKK